MKPQVMKALNGAKQKKLYEKSVADKIRLWKILE
jgi:hypothetical protein